jgi:nucleoid DNA-binding protein
MSILYRLIPRRNPQQPQAAPKWYAEAVSRGTITLEQLLDIACEDTTLNRDEMRMGLNRAFKTAENYLEKGFTVHLGDLGYMSLTVRSEGAVTPEEATGGFIRDIVPHFIFGKPLRDRMKRCKVERKSST